MRDPDCVKCRTQNRGYACREHQETAQALVDHGHAATLPEAVQALSDALSTPVPPCSDCGDPYDGPFHQCAPEWTL